MRMLPICFVCWALAGSLTGQQTPPKPDPAPLFEPDLKRGPTEPWLQPARTHHAAPRATDKAAGTRTPRDPFAAAGAVYFDESAAGDVTVAARGYKASFAPGRATFVPFLGSAALKNHPVTFRLTDAEVAGVPLALTPAPAPERASGEVRFDYGDCVARYAFRDDGMEQSFEFRRLPARGPIRIRVDVETDLRPSDDGVTLTFLGPEGGASYGAAWAVDASGRRLALERELRGSAIEIVVPESFVTSAELPLVIDPLVGTVTTIHSDSYALREPDITYDASTDRYAVCFELVFSLTDSDVYSYELDANGALVPNSLALIDVSGTESWQAPRIANNNIANRHLVVAQVSAGGVSPFSIRGRTRDAGSTTTGSPFTIASPGSTDPGDKIRPDVAGDPHTTPPTYFTVIWERVYSSTDHDVHARQTTADLDPTLVGPGNILVENSGQYDTTPQISNSVGAPLPNAVTQKALVVFKRNMSGIWARPMRWDGALDPLFAVDTSSILLDNPSASTVAAPDAAGNYLYLVAWEHGYLTDGGDTHDIDVALCDQQGQVVSQVFNLQQLEGNGAYIRWNQFTPEVTTDGCRFVVTYGENYLDSGDLDVRTTTLHTIPISPTSWQLGVSEARAWPAGRSTIEDLPAIASVFECSDPAANGFARYALAWHDENGGATHLIDAQLYDGMMPTGGFSLVATACGTPTIDASGRPALREPIRIWTSGEALIAGLPRTPPLRICSGARCLMGVDSFATLPASTIIVVPCNSSLLGGALALQGVSTVGSGYCFGFLSVSDTLIVTVR